MAIKETSRIEVRSVEGGYRVALIRLDRYGVPRPHAPSFVGEVYPTLTAANKAAAAFRTRQGIG